MLGKDLIIKKNLSFTNLTPGTPDWMIYWAAFPEQQTAMLAWQKALSENVATLAKQESITVVDSDDIVIAFCPADRVHSVWPFLKHRRSHVMVLSPNREEIILLKDSLGDWNCPSRHIHAEESYFSAAERALEEKIGLTGENGNSVLRGRIRELHYEKEPCCSNDYEATMVYEYVLPNLTEISADSQLTSVGIRELLQTKNTISINGLFFRLFNEVVSTGELKWQK